MIKKKLNFIFQFIFQDAKSLGALLLGVGAATTAWQTGAVVQKLFHIEEKSETIERGVQQIEQGVQKIEEALNLLQKQIIDQRVTSSINASSVFQNPSADRKSLRAALERHFVVVDDMNELPRPPENIVTKTTERKIKQSMPWHLGFGASMGLVASINSDTVGNISTYALDGAQSDQEIPYQSKAKKNDRFRLDDKKMILYDDVYILKSDLEQAVKLMHQKSPRDRKTILKHFLKYRIEASEKK